MSFNYFWLDNVIWAVGMGIFKSKELPEHLTRVWRPGDFGGRRNGWVVSSFGGMSSLKKARNSFSLMRVSVGIMSHLLFLYYYRLKAKDSQNMPKDTGSQPSADGDFTVTAKLSFHSLELVRGLRSQGWKVEAR